ncbi:hypothetical protein [Blastococcus sp. CCUG 61487]|uniref:hypothetical protein n=1 Tax=Blastococcus sp. CCUG 61487 TaxID=1840703 RepID=UPI0010C1126F|nr:hypothetical protein [Blastococcus sp. CCUG 61487]TKJ22823.1 hypothetical protein A6V29_05810 [Blastococcus sp. CCUG 61487]
MPDDRLVGAPAAPGTGTGARRLLVALYAIFALAAGARAGVQIGTRFDEAPVAYLLSALAAAVYLVATIALVRGGRAGRRTALAAICFELVGVLVIGAVSLAMPDAFPDETVWSGFGRGYLYIPLVLPLLGLFVLRRSGPADR